MKTMIAKNPGHCAACGKPIARGQSINFFGRGRAEHTDCAGVKSVAATNGSVEDYACSDRGYEDQCAARYDACNGGGW